MGLFDGAIDGKKIGREVMEGAVSELPLALDALRQAYPMLADLLAYREVELTVKVGDQDLKVSFALKPKAAGG